MHLLVAVSPHGFGHAAQVAPVINALVRRLPALRVTVQSTVAAWFLRQRIDTDFQLVDRSSDFGLMMNSALNIDLESSTSAYAELHGSWEARVSEEASLLRALAPSLVLADVPYLSLAAAQAAAIPALALCSLNWADIYRHYFSHRREAPCVLQQMETAYSAAAAFLCPEPCMPMHWLNNTVSIAPIAARGQNRRAALNELLGLDSSTALVLVAPGGVHTRFAMERWPADQHIHWLVSENWRVVHPCATAFERTGMAFTDLVTSCDAVLGKCGYGTVTECVVNGTPLLYIPRPDWPEEPILLSWLNNHRAAVEVSPEKLASGNFGDSVAAARALHVKPCAADGAEQAAAVLQSHLQPVSSAFDSAAHADDGITGRTV
jgi:hypothetical protein